MLGFKFEDERQIAVMLFYIKTCLKFTVKGTSDPDAAENCTTFIKCADFTNRQSIHFNFRMVKGILHYFMYGFFFMFTCIYKYVTDSE